MKEIYLPYKKIFLLNNCVQISETARTGSIKINVGPVNVTHFQHNDISW